jgi:hypothetical protein
VEDFEMQDPIVTFELPREFLARFPDGDYTIGRGADPRSTVERATDPDGSIAKARGKVVDPRQPEVGTNEEIPREAAE